MSRRWLFLVVSWLVCGIPTGCARNVYELTLTPKGGQVERELTCWAEGSPDKPRFSEVEAARIDALYPSRFTPADNRSIGFRGTFGESQPDDVGGSGNYWRFTTPLGDTYSYVERFRGDDDAAGQFERRSKAAADLARHAKAWAAREFKSEPDYARLEKYLDREFARDLLNLSLLAGPIHQSTVGVDLLEGNLLPLSDEIRRELNERFWFDRGVRAGQYLVERDYLKPEHLPQVLRAASTNRWHDVLADTVERKLGRAADHPRGALALLRDPQRLQESVESYLRETSEYREEAERQRATMPNAEPPPPLGILNAILLRLIDGSIVMSSDLLTVNLALAEKPDRTNGIWDPAKRQVRWQALAIDQKTPHLCYAHWSAPNAEKQTAQFGWVAVRGDALVNYAVWYRGLTDDERAQWDGYLATVTPGPTLTRRIQTFHFKDESEAASQGRADAMREILVPALSAKH